MSSYHNLSANAVCDTCRARKVKCDRNDPCGNCMDGNIRCVRTPPALRRTQNSSKRRRSTESEPAHKSVRRRELDITQSPPAHSVSMPQSPSIIEAHDFIRREISYGRHMPADRLAVLNSAMSFVAHLSQTTRPSDALESRAPPVADILEGIVYPSTELLYWILRELRGNSIGPHVLDYFKHVSPKSLRRMGLALIEKDGNPETLLLSSICVNSAAFKFINTILSVDQPDEMDEGLRACATRHLDSVKLAMTRIHLLAAPSLLFLQSLLCSAFIAQGTGDSTSCWTFISAACKICEDLSLEIKVKACQNASDDDLELYYCFVWCHVLDKNYSMMLGRSRCLLEHEGLDSVFSSSLNQSMSSLFSTYLHFVPIQAIFISELHPGKIVNNTSLLSRVEDVVADLLKRLERMHARITELNGPSDAWGGLYMGSELSTIQFSYHSLRTSILRSIQICSPRKPYVDKECLDSARMAMSTLRAIQVEASTTISDIRAHVSYMHWTVLYHPLTPFFVLFCNVVATSNEEDFHTLQRVASGLDGLSDLSSSIAKLQRLFSSFIDLCEGIVASSTINDGLAMATVGQQQELTCQKTQILTQVLPSRNANGSLQLSSSFGVSVPETIPAITFDAPVGDSGPGHLDPVWGLFDAQPTLDWLDADFSFFDNSL